VVRLIAEASETKINPHSGLDSGGDVDGQTVHPDA